MSQAFGDASNQITSETPSCAFRVSIRIVGGRGGRRRKMFFIQMKKLLQIAVLILGGVSAMSAVAQQPVIKAGRSVAVCPLSYTNSGKIACYLSIVDGDQAKIYDWTLNEIRQFQLKGKPMRITEQDGDKEYEFIFTQYLFNDDDEFEYLVATEDWHKVEIVNESGDKLGEFDFGSRGLDNDEVDLLSLNSESRYLLFDIGVERWIYSINQATGAVHEVAENVMGLSVRPTVTNGSAPVEILLGNPAATMVSVNVVAANGSQAMSETIKAGESGVSLNVGNLAKGVYVVNVAGYESSKFIIR